MCLDVHLRSTSPVKNFKEVGRMQEKCSLKENLEVRLKENEKIFIVDIDLPTAGRFASRIPVFLKINGEEERIGNEIILFIDKELRNELESLNYRVKTEVERHAVRLKSGLFITTEGGVKRISRILNKYIPEYERLEEKIKDALMRRESEYIKHTLAYINEKEGKIEIKGLTDGIKLYTFPIDRKVETLIEDSVRRVCRETIDSAIERLIEETENRLNELATKLKNAKHVIHLPAVREALEKEIQATTSLAEELGIEIDEEKKRLMERFQRMASRFTEKAFTGMESGRAAALMKKLIEPKFA